MPVLRYREIPSSPPPQPKPNFADASSPSSPPKTLERKNRSGPPVVQPPTPAKTVEPLLPSPPPPLRRRSLRLSSDDFAPSPKRSRNDAAAAAAAKPLGKSDSDFVIENDDDVVVELDSLIGRVVADANQLGQNQEIKQENEEIGFLSLRSGARVAKRVPILSGGDDNSSGGVARDESTVEVKVEVMEEEEVEVEEEEEEEAVSRQSRSENRMKSPRRHSREEKGKRRLSDGDQGVVGDGTEEDGLSSSRDRMEEDGLSSSRDRMEEDGLSSSRRYTREEKGKSVLSVVDEEVGGFMEGDELIFVPGDENNFSRPTWEEQEEEEMVLASDDDSMERLNLELGLNSSNVDMNLGMDVEQGMDLAGGGRNKSRGDVDEQYRTWRQQYMKDQNKRIAKRNALKYALYKEDDEGRRSEQEGGEDAEDGAEVPPADSCLNVEDWPGPFSTAMKIIRDREKNLGQVKNSSSGKGAMPLVSWTPKERGPEWKKRISPSLQSMCLKILAENVDCIGSLIHVPEVLRHILCQMFCDSRRMNAHFFSLLLEGSPCEIRVTDCSWLEEEEFESSIKACDTSNLTVLQLDLCGHCISDASLLKAVAPKGFPVLTKISLKGACRISDAGLKALVTSAPVLRSLNLSHCCLLTDLGIETIADSLGSIVHELYLDDCNTLDAMRILPSLKRLMMLEVLSLRGIGGVSDKFIRELLCSNGYNMKELVLADCVKLTDSSLKVIAETCPQLCVLDLSYVRKLTDVGMVHLANGCRGIQDLRLCRNAFSDDAIAAFLEASGVSLKQLSLNNISKVGQNTTISLARRCKNLERLDLSWCRSLTDEALGLIADSCMTLRVLTIFGCTQITKTFLDGHSNPNLHVVGIKETPILEHIKRPDFQQGALQYSAVPLF